VGIKMCSNLNFKSKWVSINIKHFKVALEEFINNYTPWNE